jgi:hypothetical protein
MTTPLLVVGTAFSFAAAVPPTDEVPMPVVAPHREKQHPSLCYEVMSGDQLRYSLDGHFKYNMN